MSTNLRRVDTNCVIGSPGRESEMEWIAHDVFIVSEFLWGNSSRFVVKKFGVRVLWWNTSVQDHILCKLQWTRRILLAVDFIIFGWIHRLQEPFLFHFSDMIQKICWEHRVSHRILVPRVVVVDDEQRVAELGYQFGHIGLTCLLGFAGILNCFASVPFCTHGRLSMEEAVDFRSVSFAFMLRDHSKRFAFIFSRDLVREWACAQLGWNWKIRVQLWWLLTRMLSIFLAGRHRVHKHETLYNRTKALALVEYASAVWI